MSRKTKWILAWCIFLILQVILLNDYTSLFQWGKINIKGMECTCPDASVPAGELYLKSITPDCLKKYDLDYSEIYLTQRPCTDLDPMGVDHYIIKGKVIGKDRVSELDPWNPKVKVESWHEVDIIIEWLVKGAFLVQLIIIMVIMLFSRHF